MHGLTTNCGNGPATTIPFSIPFIRLARRLRSAQARYLHRVRNTFTSTVVVAGVPAEATRSCGSRPTTMGSREWISSRRTMVPQPRLRNRFALLPRFGSYANLFLPVGDDASDTGTFRANFSSALRIMLSELSAFVYALCLINHSYSRANYSID